MLKIGTFRIISVKMDSMGFQADSMRETIQPGRDMVERKDLESECGITQQRGVGGPSMTSEFLENGGGEADWMAYREASVSVGRISRAPL